MLDQEHISVKPHVSAEIVIEGMKAGDWEQMRAIYLESIATGQATFETEAPAWEDWDAAHLRTVRLVARLGEMVVGWAALSPVSKRRVYDGVAEVSVYVASNHRRSGIGSSLLNELIKQSEKHGIWTLQAAVFPENQATIALHLRCGFREVGRRKFIGSLNGVWRDTLLLERRSQVVGR